jgi:hypothetical protein
MNLSKRISGIFFGVIALCCLSVGARAQFVETPSPEIVSAWKLNTEDLVVVFRYDGTFYLVDGSPAHPGMERGTFQWDNATGAFSVNTIVDTNGDAGFSHPGAATTVTVSGNTLNYTVPGEGTFSFTRVVNTASAIVGSWAIPGEKFSVTFLADNTYYLSEETNDIPFGYTGIEKGTYTWNSTTKSFTATAAIDTNGDVGVNGITAGVTINITGNTMVFDDGVDPTSLLRITTNPTPLRLPDFGTVRFANYVQSSNAAPALSPFNVAQESYPYSAEVFVDPAVGATAPTIKIGAGTPLIIDADPWEPGSFGIEQGYATLAELNTILPASTALQFKNGTGIANLTTGASLTFPSIPRIIVGSGASWSSAVYRFGGNEVLQWTLPTGFVASQYLTVLSVYDPATDQDVVEAELHGEVTFLDLAGKLEPNKQYEAELEFYRIDTSTTAGNGVFTGKQGYTLSGSSTFFKIRSRNVFPESPSIFEQPVSQDGVAGSPLLLTVGINEGAFPFSTFQWFRNNQEMEGQTGNCLHIPNFNPDAHSGRYKVVVSNSQGQTESSLANVGRVGTDARKVQNIVAYKRKISEQQSATLLTSVGAGFDARVEGIGITATFPSTNITLTKPAGTSVPLMLDGDHWDAETYFATFTGLQTAFPNGTYRINIGSDSIPISLSATNYPNQPLVTSSAGTWVNGKLQITVSQAAAGFTLTSNSTTGDGFVDLAVIDIATDSDIINEFANTNPSDPDFVTATISPNQLTLGKSYEVEVEFDEVVSSTNLFNQTWGAPPDGVANAFGILSTATVFTIEVVPDPVGNLYTLWRARFFTPTQLANPAISGDEVDFDNDGIANILEFVLGGSPIVSNPNLLKDATSVPTAGGQNLVFSYDRKTEANGIGQVIETSSTLAGTWTPAVHGVAGVVITTVDLDANNQRVTATIPSTQTMLFVRLKAIR